MKQIKSLYPNNVTFGHYGVVPPGSVIEVSDFDYASVKDDPFWKLERPPSKKRTTSEGKKKISSEKK